MQEKGEWHKELLAQLDAEQKQVSVSDPECRRMHTGNGNVVGYNAQIAVDAKNKLIAAEAVTNDVTDYRQLAGLALEAKANLELKATEVVADTSANTQQGLYGKSRFKYDQKQDVYVCPAGGELTYRFSTYELGRGLRYYRASGCKDCVLKKQCTRNKGNRTITREDNEALMEAMVQRMQQQPEKFAQRKLLAEHPFGTIKRWFGYTHFLTKGLVKVRTEWSLMTLVYNLKRVLKLVNSEQLMAAVGVKVPETI